MASPKRGLAFPAGSTNDQLFVWAQSVVRRLRWHDERRPAVNLYGAVSGPSVTDDRVTDTCLVMLSPANAAAAAGGGYVSAVSPGVGFTIAGAPVGATYNYAVMYTD